MLNFFGYFIAKCIRLYIIHQRCSCYFLQVCVKSQVFIRAFYLTFKSLAVSILFKNIITATFLCTGHIANVWYGLLFLLLNVRNYSHCQSK